MAFKEVSGQKQYKTWDQWPVGGSIIGTYIEDGEQDTKYGMQKWFDLEISESSFEIDKSLTLRLNGNGSLNNKMEKIIHGSKIKVQYDGINQLPSGPYKGQDFHDVKVFKDDEAEKETQENYSGL